MMSFLDDKVLVNDVLSGLSSGDIRARAHELQCFCHEGLSIDFIGIGRQTPGGVTTSKGGFVASICSLESDLMPDANAAIDDLAGKLANIVRISGALGC